MPQPYNYSINVPDPSKTVMDGFNLGRQFKQEKKTAEYQEAMNADIARVMSGTPTAKDFADLTIKYPQMNEQFEKAWGLMSQGRQQNSIASASQVYAALESDRPDLAIQVLNEQAEAAKNSGDKLGFESASRMAQLVEANPVMGKSSVGIRLASMMGKDEFVSTFNALNREKRETDVADLTKSQAEARKAAIDADYADSKALMDLEKKGWDILKLQEDVSLKKANQKLAMANVALSKAKTEEARNKHSLAIEKLTSERDEKARQKAADLESARFNVDNMLNTIERILAIPAGDMNDAFGAYDQSFVGRAMDTFDQDVANTRALIENLDAQAFLSQVPNLKGFGQLSNAEGQKLTQAFQNFSMSQSPDQITGNMKEAQRLLMKTRRNMADKYGVPDTIADTPAAQPSAEEIDAIMKEMGF